MTLTLLERLRLDADLELELLSERSGVPVRTIRHLETGQVRRPQLKTLRPLARALDCKVSALAEDFRAERAAA